MMNQQQVHTVAAMTVKYQGVILSGVKDHRPWLVSPFKPATGTHHALLKTAGSSAG